VGESTKEDEESDEGWMQHSLVFEKTVQVLDPMARKDEKYTTFDPLKYKNVQPMSQHQKRLRASKNLEEW